MSDPTSCVKAQYDITIPTNIRPLHLLSAPEVRKLHDLVWTDEFGTFVQLMSSGNIRLLFDLFETPLNPPHGRQSVYQSIKHIIRQAESLITPLE